MWWFWILIIFVFGIGALFEPSVNKEQAEKRKKLDFEKNRKRFFCPACFTELHAKSQQICHQCSKDIINPINYFDLPNDFNFSASKKTKRIGCIECGSVALMDGMTGSYCEDCADG